MNAEPSRAGYRTTFLVLAAGAGAFALLQSLVSPVLPTIQEALNTTQTNVTWVLTAYLLSASICTPIVGRLGDMIGKKKMFVFALIALAVGSLLAAVAPSLSIMIIARVIQGVGGGVLPLSFGIIRDEFPREKVPGAVGVIAALTAVGAGLGIVLAGPIVDALSYHWLFWIPMAVIAVAAIAAFFVIPESEVKTAGKINWLAALLLSGWLVALLLAVSEAPSWGWGSPKVLGLLIVAIIVAATWVRLESRSANPLIDMRMMTIRAVWTTNLVALLFGVAMFGTFAFLPAFLQTPSEAGYGFGASITTSGLMILPQTVGMFVLGVLAGRLGERFGSKNLVVAGSFVSVAALALLALAHDHAWEIYLSSAVLGIGFGLAFSAMSNLIVAAVPAEQTGVASGMNANIRTIGGSLGAAFMASIVAAHVGPSGLPSESGYSAGFLLLAAALLLGAFAAVLIPAIPRSPKTHHEPAVELRHGELAMVAGGTVVGNESE
ncbi:MAG: transporter [Jatrophihabitantaceae bacterium]|nr:transporter [Jatrophihabitantaceae bacterium]